MSDDNKIVPFTHKPGMIVVEHKESGCMAWTCWCGGSAFRLDVGGTVHCWECDQVQIPRWFKPEDVA